MAEGLIPGGAAETNDVSIFGEASRHQETVHPSATARLHGEEADRVVLTPGQTVIHVQVTPGGVIELPFGADAHFLARLGDGNLAIKVGDVTVILLGYASAAAQNPPVIEAADGKPLDVAGILDGTDPALDIHTAPGTSHQSGQGAHNTGGIFEHFANDDAQDDSNRGGHDDDRSGPRGFDTAASQDDAAGPSGTGDIGTHPLQHALAAASVPPDLLEGLDFNAATDEDTRLVGQLTANDSGGGLATFHTVGIVPDGLTVDPDGAWSFDPRGGYDYLAGGEKATVAFQFQADSGSTEIGTATITIDGRNDVPTIAGDTAGSVTEDDKAHQTATGTLAVTDADHDQSSAQTAVNAASTHGYGSYSVDADGSWTYTLANANTDVQALGAGDTLSDSFVVTSKDGTASQTVTITIDSADHAPTITAPNGGDAASLSIPENTVDVTTVQASDVDINDTLTYSIVGGADASLFHIDGTTGLLAFNAAPDYETPQDHDLDNSYAVTVQVSDGHGGTDTQAITVSVTDMVLEAREDHVFTNIDDISQLLSGGAVKDEWLLANDTGDSPHVVAISSDPPYTDGTYSIEDATQATATGHIDITQVGGTIIDRSDDTHGDIILGSDTASTLIGGHGNDIISSGAGADTIFGNAGDDVIHYTAGDTVHGGADLAVDDGNNFGFPHDDGDTLVFAQSIDLTDSQYDGMFDGIETIRTQGADPVNGPGVNLTLDATDVLNMSDHQSNFFEGNHYEIRVTLGALDHLYLSAKDGGSWVQSGTYSYSGGAYEIYVHEANGHPGSEDAYVQVSYYTGQVSLNQDAP
jgi:VCBS repeat-containing protein